MIPPVPKAPAPRHRRFIASAHGNLPAWPADPPAVDRSGQAFVLVGIGPGAPAALAGWREAIAALGRPLYERSGETLVEPPLLAWFDATLAEARVGWRLMLAGPPSEALRLAARARAAGMIDDEIRAFAIEDGVARVQCIHCGTSFRQACSPGDETACPGCGRRLLVHRHFSRARAAMLAFISDFEKTS